MDTVNRIAELNGVIRSALNEITLLHAEVEGDDLVNNPNGELNQRHAVVTFVEDDESLGSRFHCYGSDFLETRDKESVPDDEKVRIVANEAVAGLAVMETVKVLNSNKEALVDNACKMKAYGEIAIDLMKAKEKASG